jgi:repressor LexA
MIRQQNDTVSHKCTGRTPTSASIHHRDDPRTSHTPTTSAPQVDPTDPAAQLGAMIRQARHEAGMTQQALGNRIGLSKSQISQIESGVRSISTERARMIESVLGVSAGRDGRGGRIVTAAAWCQLSPEIRESMQQTDERMRRITAKLKQALTAAEPAEALRQLVDHARPNVADFTPLRRSIPVINKVAAGYPAEFTDLDYPASVADEYIACPDITDPDAFAARVVGESMLPEYREGEIVVFSPELPTPDGSDCFVRLERDNETTFKRIFFEDDGESIRLQPLNPAYPPRVVHREDVAGMYAAAYVMRKIGT